MSAIKIKAIAKHHNLFLMTIGISLLMLVLAVSAHLWQEYRLVLMFCALTSLVIFFVGVVKRLEPHYSVVLSKESICYQHKYGNWTIEWKNIQRIGEVLIDIGIEKRQLPYVGIKLKSEMAISDSISLRLASRLPHEQRPLTTIAITQSLTTLEKAQISFEPYKLASNESIKGPKAFFMHHTNMLQHAYGYHLFLPASALDRGIADFITLLRECKSHADTYPEN